MRMNSVWLGIITLSAGVAFGFALALASVGVAVALASGAPQSAAADQPPAEHAVYAGMVTDSRCGAKHSAGLSKNASDCTRACVHGGKDFSLVDSDHAYVLKGDPVAMSRFAGRRAQVAGTLNGNVLQVSSIAAGT